MDDLEGRVAVITGAASGIGWALAKAFATEGAKVVLSDIEGPALEQKARELAASIGQDRVSATVCDVSELDQVVALRDHALASFGAYHVVCNNAGVGAGGEMARLTENDWSFVLGVNLWGVIHGVEAFLPGLIEQGEGHIVNTASVAGLFAAPFMGPYTVSKYGVVALSETLYNELAMAASPVGVSVLCPSWVATNIGDIDRNRPEELRNPPSVGADPTLGFGEVLQQFIQDKGMDPAEVASQVVAAVRAKQFYILTHDDTRPAVLARMNAIVNGQAPPMLMPQ